MRLTSTVRQQTEGPQRTVCRPMRAWVALRSCQSQSSLCPRTPTRSSRSAQDLATSRGDFCCAAVGFDEATLHPTYSLTWGVAGPSMALSIAQGLDFDGDILAAARARLADAAQGAASSTAQDGAPTAASGTAQGSLQGLAEEVRELRGEAAAAQRALDQAVQERDAAADELLACELEAASVEGRAAEEVGVRR